MSTFYQQQKKIVIVVVAILFLAFIVSVLIVAEYKCVRLNDRCGCCSTLKKKKKGQTHVPRRYDSLF